MDNPVQEVLAITMTVIITAIIITVIAFMGARHNELQKISYKKSNITKNINIQEIYDKYEYEIVSGAQIVNIAEEFYDYKVDIRIESDDEYTLSQNIYREAGGQEKTKEQVIYDIKNIVETDVKYQCSIIQLDNLSNIILEFRYATVK